MTSNWFSSTRSLWTGNWIRISGSNQKFSIFSHQTVWARLTQVRGFWLPANSSSKYFSLACRLIESGVWAIINPYGYLDSWVLRSVAERYEIPHIITSWEYPFSGKFFAHTSDVFNFTLSLHPSTKLLSQAVFDYIRFNKEWRTFSILVDSRQGCFYCW